MCVVCIWLKISTCFLSSPIKTAKELRHFFPIKPPRKWSVFLVVLQKPPRKLPVFLAVQQNRQGIAQFSWRISSPVKDYTFPWLLVVTAKETFLAVQFWPSSKFLATKVLSVWGSVGSRCLLAAGRHGAPGCFLGGGMLLSSWMHRWMHHWVDSDTNFIEF